MKNTNLKPGKNVIRLSGIITEIPAFDHTAFGGNFYRTVISVKRRDGSDDKLLLKIPEELLTKDIRPGKAVKISGALHSYIEHVKDRKQVKKHGKTHLHVFILVRSMKIISNEDINPFMSNRAHIQGHICSKPLHKQTIFGRDVTDVLVHIDRPYGRGDTVPCVLWGEAAVKCMNLPIGTEISVYGRFQNRTYTKHITETLSETRMVYEVSALEVEII